MTTKPARLLIVDDSTFFVRTFKYMLSAYPGISIVGVANNGSEALTLTDTLKPDIVTMDIHMPVMNGIEAIEQIMAHCPTPILVLSDDQSETMAFEALEKGALDVSQKPLLTTDLDSNLCLFNNIEFLSSIKVVRHIAGVQRRPVPTPAPKRPTHDHFFVIAVACSTGGPKALKKLLGSLPATLPACLLIVQHMSPGFCETMAGWLNSSSELKVKIGRHGDPLEPSTAILAPEGTHMTVSAHNRIALVDTEPVDGHKPSASILFQSVGARFGKRSIAIVLTGMGSDGAAGIGQIQDNGGITICQDEQSSLIFGMPNAAIETGKVQHVVGLEQIPLKLVSIIGGG